MMHQTRQQAAREFTETAFRQRFGVDLPEFRVGLDGEQHEYLSWLESITGKLTALEIRVLTELLTAPHSC